MNRSIYSIEELHEEINIVAIAECCGTECGRLKQLASATQYLMKPEGELKIMGVTYKSV